MSLAADALTSPACGGGRREAPGGGSFHSGSVACGDTPTPPSPASGRGSAPFSWSRSNLNSSCFRLAQTEAARSGMDRAAFAFQIGWNLFGRVENGRGAATKLRHDDRAFGTIDQAGAAQQRGKILDLAVVVEDLVMQRGEELCEAHPFLRGDLLQRVPERHLQPDRGGMAAHPQRSGLRFIVALRLVREQMAHGVPPVRL